MSTSSQDSSKKNKKDVYYSQDFKTVKEVPEHRLNYRKASANLEDGGKRSSQKIESSDREVMMAPNNIDFFYAAEETSERIWRIDERLNKIYVWLSRGLLTAGFIALAWHIKQRKDMREAATNVSNYIEKEGARATLDKDGQVVVYMDGKVQQVFQTKNEEEKVIPQKQSADDAITIVKKDQLLNSHMGQQIQIIMKNNQNQHPRNGKRRDYQYYAQIMKPELIKIDTELHKKIMGNECILISLQPFGVHSRTNYSKQTQIMRDPDAMQSIFDEEAFKFYIIKYAEILGLDSLLIVSSQQRKMSYDQKRKVIEFIVRTEQELGIVSSSWKHCLLFLYHNGTISHDELMAEFTSPEAIEKARVNRLRSETFDSYETIQTAPTKLPSSKNLQQKQAANRL